MPEQDEELVEDLGLEEEDKQEDDFEIPEEGEFVVPEPTRREKKKNRFAEQIRRAEAAEAEAQRLRAELEASRRVAPPPPTTPAPDPYEDKIRDAEKRRAQLFEAYNNAVAASGQQGMAKEVHDDYLGRARDIDAELTDLRVERKLARVNASAPGDQAKLMIRARHADVFAHPLAAAEAEVAYKRATAPRSLQGDGKPDNLETLDEVMEEVRKRYRLGNHRHGGHDVDPAQARRYAGVPRGTGAPVAARSGYKMTDLDREMADIAFPNLPPKERYQLYARDMGKKEG